MACVRRDETIADHGTLLEVERDTFRREVAAAYQAATRAEGVEAVALLAVPGAMASSRRSAIG